MSLTHDAGCPEEVLAAIAWYPEGLDAELRGTVEAHAADCAVCREELAFLRGDTAPPAPQVESERVYARVLERIEAYEDRARSVAAAPRRARSAPSRGAPARAAAALLAAVCVGALAAWLFSRLVAPEAVYRTAGGTPEVSAAAPGQSAQALDVVFRPDATAERIHAALRAIGGEIVSGPTQLGVYRVRLGPEADASAAARVLRGEGQGVATFAEQAPR